MWVQKRVQGLFRLLGNNSQLLWLNWKFNLRNAIVGTVVGG
jgi:hypothetical protein